MRRSFELICYAPKPNQFVEFKFDGPNLRAEEVQNLTSHCCMVGNGLPKRVPISRAPYTPRYFFHDFRKVGRKYLRSGSFVALDRCLLG